jgi:hypothetical protein
VLVHKTTALSLVKVRISSKSNGDRFANRQAA